MTVRVSIKEGLVTPLDDILPNRGMEPTHFKNFEELDAPIPERISRAVSSVPRAL